MFLVAAPSSASAPHLTTEAPAGFDELASAHEILVDVYFGGSKIGESIAVVRPGKLIFRNAGELLKQIPQVTVTSELEVAIANELSTHSELACVQSNTNDCGILKPSTLGIIYDEDRFRVDLFINPKFLRTVPAAKGGYLPQPDSALSVTDTIGVDASGTIGGKSTLDVQNRTIIASRNARIRADTAIASGLGLVVDDFVAEVDRKDLRYSGGLFWAPANDFIGQRRILGAGAGTQFDTWADQQSLHSTPLIVFLEEPSRIDVLVDSRLVSSRSYPAGNVEVDTSSLPEGSYAVLIRIHQANGSVQEQQRFFIKNSQVPARAHPIIFGFAGVLANTEDNVPLSASRTFFYEVGTARRLSNTIALDVSALGTQHKSMIEGGGWLITGLARLRAAGLVSTSGDWGALLQVGTAGHGPFNMTLDLRRIWSRDGQPLIPLASSVSSFDVAPPAGVQLAVGSYTQATASIGFRLVNGFLSFVGSYRKDRSLPADYTLGPSLSLPVVTHNQIQIVMDASAQRSRDATAAFAGLRVLFSSKHLSVGGSAGVATQKDRSGTDVSETRAVGSVSAQWTGEGPANSQVSVEGDADRNIGSSTVHAEGLLTGPIGNFRADLLKNVEDSHMPQYNFSFQSGMAAGLDASTWGSRELEQSALIVSIGGDAQQASFTVIVDNVARGKVKVGHRLALFLPAYRTYKVRVVPSLAQNLSFDSAEREVTLYPGNVRNLSWSADSLVTLFGQAVLRNGSPIANALVQSVKGIAQTDGNGYFQIDVRQNDPITISTATNHSCTLNTGKIVPNNDFASIGKVICQ